jgi:hypothetical protein
MLRICNISNFAFVLLKPRNFFFFFFWDMMDQIIIFLGGFIDSFVIYFFGIKGPNIYFRLKF